MNSLSAIITEDGEEKLLMDGLEIYRGYHINWSMLADSIVHDGEHEFFVCSCGKAGCAGLFVPQEVAHANNAITWKVVVPKPEGEYRFDRDQYLDAILGAFVKADAFKKGEREDFSIGPYGFFLTAFNECLGKLKRWQEWRRQGVSWEEVQVRSGGTRPEQGNEGRTLPTSLS